MVRILDIIGFYLLLFLIVFTPLAFGAVHTWAYTLTECAALLMIACPLLQAAIKGEFVWVKAPFNVFALVLLAYLFLQTLPLPASLIANLSPETLAEHVRRLAPGEALSSMGAIPLSLTPRKTWVDWSKIATYFAVFFFIVNRVRTRSEINLLIAAILSVACFEVLYGLWGKIEGTYTIWWWPNKFGGPHISGTYINSNHLAGYLEMAALLGAGFVFSFFKRSRSREPRVKVSWIMRALEFFQNRGSSFQLFTFYSTLLIFSGLFLTASRGGMLALMGGLVFAGTASFRQWRPYLKPAFLALILGALLSAAWILQGEETLSIFDRYKSLLTIGDLFQGEQKAYSNDFPLRLRLFHDLIAASRDYPFFGIGLGAFSELYPKYYPPNIVGSFQYAHNDWLQWLLETGWVGLAFLAAVVILFVGNVWRLLRKRNDPYVVGIGWGALGGLTALFLHSFVDFNLHIPANAVLFSVLAGIAYVAIHNQVHQGRETSLLQTRTLRPAKPILWCAVTGLALIIGMMGIRDVAHLRAEDLCPTQINSTLKLDKNPPLDDIKKALILEPGNAACWGKLALRFEKLKSLEPKSFFQKYYTEKNVQVLTEALRLNPVHSYHHALLGREYFHLSLLEPENSQKWLDRSFLSYENAVYYDRRKSGAILTAAKIWLEYSQGAPRTDHKKLYAEKAFALMKTIVRLWPFFWKYALDTAFPFYPRLGLVAKVIPGSSESEEFKKLNLRARQRIIKRLGLGTGL